MPVSKAQMKAVSKYNSKSYDTIQARTLKMENLPQIIEAASKKRGISRSQYIVMAIKAQLFMDGMLYEQSQINVNRDESDKNLKSAIPNYNVDMSNSAMPISLEEE